MQPITRQRLVEIPDLTALAALDPQRYPCLLQSAVHDSERSRWDILLAFPQSSLQRRADGSVRENNQPLAEKGFLAELDKRWQAGRSAAVDDDLPFHGGWALYLAYELAAEAEPGLHLPRDEDGTPVAVALRCPAAVLVDHQRGVALLVAEPEHASLIDCMLADIERARSLERCALACSRDRGGC